MDNKLSELSELSKSLYLRCVDRGAGETLYTPCGKDYPSGKGYYSQEYVSALLTRIQELEVSEIKPEGLKLMIEAIGAHGYIVGCLVQGRPDLALEESRKWANAFSQAAEQSNG